MELAPFKVALAPFMAIFITGRNLLLHDVDEDYEVYGWTMRKSTFLKIFVNVFEAIPQLTLSCIYIANNGGFKINILNVVSSIFSSGSFIMGITASCIYFIQILEIQGCEGCRQYRQYRQYRQI